MIRAVSSNDPLGELAAGEMHPFFTPLAHQSWLCWLLVGETDGQPDANDSVYQEPQRTTIGLHLKRFQDALNDHVSKSS
jgi:hypothetical protein